MLYPGSWISVLMEGAPRLSHQQEIIQIDTSSDYQLFEASHKVEGVNLLGHWPYAIASGLDT
jgi:hypothetical protein